ncbi:lysophospholipid acyltransferase family protein [Thermodesulfobacteriota bacterium]
MKKMFEYILSLIYLIVFGVLLGIFHLVQVVCWNVWGYTAQKRAVEMMSYLIIESLAILGSRVEFKGFEKLPKDCPLIIVSNHQSQYDIPPIVWGFRKHHPKFISKIQLGKGIPSISYNLRKGGSVLIDRKNRSQSIKAIIKLGRQIEENNYSACIFPEGTRSKDGKVKTFKVGGLGTLLKTSPSAAIVPFAVNGNYLLQRFPMGVGEKLTYTVLDPIARENHTAEEISEMCELAIKKELDQI